jgi:integrase
MKPLTQDWIKRNSVLVRGSNNLAPLGACRVWVRQDSQRKALVRWPGFKSPVTVQRAAWAVYNGQFPPGMYKVVSTCGNNRCVEQSHLTLAPKGAKFQTSEEAAAEAAASAAANAATGAAAETGESSAALAAVRRLPDETQQLISLVEASVSHPATKRLYRSRIKSFFGWCNTTSPAPSGFNRDTISRFRDEMLASGYAPATINGTLITIRILAQELAFKGSLTALELEAIRAVKNVTGAAKRTPTWLSLAELNEVLTHPPGQTPAQRLKARTALIVMSLTGLRVSEVANLKWRHLQVLDDRPVLKDVEAKGHKRITVGLPPVGAEQLGIFRRWLENLYQRPLSEDEKIFDVADSGLRDLVYSAGRMIGKSLKPHDLRRSYARLARANGASLDDVREALGHRSTEVTLRYIGGSISYREVPGDKLASRLQALKESEIPK